MKVSISANPAQSRQARHRLANPEESLSYELGKAVQELPPFYTRLLAGGISVLVFGTIAWAHFSRIDEVAVAQGKLIPSTEVRPIRASGVGSISSVKVKAGDKVKKGDLLIELDPGSTGTNVESLEKEAKEIQQRIARLEAESQGRVDGNNPEQNLLTAARLEDLQAKQGAAVAEARKQQEAVNEAKTRMDRYEENLVNAQITFRNSQESFQNAQDILAKATDRRERLATLNQQGGGEGAIVPHQEYLRAQEEEIRARDGVTQARNRVTEEQDKIVSIQKEMEAQVDRIRQAQQGMVGAQSTAVGLAPERQSQVLTQLQQSREELKKKQGEIEVAKQQRVERQKVTAPTDGVIYNIKATSGPVQQGEELISVLPANQGLVLEVKVMNQDIAFIKPGDRAKLKFATFPYQEFGIVEGEVLEISPDAVVEKDETGKDMGPVYPTKVKIAKPLVAEGKEVVFAPGMVATAEIVTRQKTVLQSLIEPVTRRFDNALRER